MLIRHLQMTPVQCEVCVAGGEGIVRMRRIVSDPAELLWEARAFVEQTLEPGASIGPHVHLGEAELLYVLSGVGVHTANGEKITLKPGVFLCIEPGLEHTYRNTGAEELRILAIVLLTTIDAKEQHCINE